jgi:hypothetical protein
MPVKYNNNIFCVYLARGPLFLPLSARGFLTLAFTMTVAPLADVTPALMKVLVSGWRDDDISVWLYFRLAGMFEEGELFSESTWSISAGAPVPSLEVDS